MFCGVRDRKSTRLNSSHLVISYAVFCLKKKKHTQQAPAKKATDKKAPAKQAPAKQLPPEQVPWQVKYAVPAAQRGQQPLPFFFFNDTATTEIYTLSLHDALPIFALSLPEATEQPHFDMASFRVRG